MTVREGCWQISNLLLRRLISVSVAHKPCELFLCLADKKREHFEWEDHIGKQAINTWEQLFGVDFLSPSMVDVRSVLSFSF